LFCLAVLLLRMPHAEAKLRTIDETGFATVANKIVDGHSLYKEACDNKPQCIFHFYSSVFTLFGMAAWIKPPGISSCGVVPITAFTGRRKCKRMPM
jgi:hypothetical protein